MPTSQEKASVQNQKLQEPTSTLPEVEATARKMFCVLCYKGTYNLYGLRSQPLPKMLPARIGSLYELHAPTTKWPLQNSECAQNL